MITLYINLLFYKFKVENIVYKVFASKFKQDKIVITKSYYSK